MNVVLTNDEYASLIRDRLKLIMLMDALYEDAEANYSHTELYLNERAANVVLKLIDYEAFQSALEDAISRKEAKKAIEENKEVTE